MFAGAVQNVMGGFVPSHQLRAFDSLWAGMKAHKRMQMMGFAAHCFESLMQLAAVDISGSMAARSP